MISLALGSGRMVADLEIATSTTEHVAEIEAPRFLRYFGSFIPRNDRSLSELPRDERRTVRAGVVVGAVSMGSFEVSR